ncbi:MAG: FISUMP domain-containing protein [Paludibacter sp.]|nr:FISUMP domain-containing protein [Paludibacter sp.]
MKTKTLYSNFKAVALGLVCLTAINGYATINYNVSFKAIGATTTLESVIVENTTQGKAVIVPAGNTLKLTDALSAIQQVNTDNSNQLICITDMQGITTVNFNAPRSGNIQINAFNLDGRKIVGMSNTILAGDCTYKLSLPQGLYVLQVKGNSFKYRSKLSILNSQASYAQLSYIGSEKASLNTMSKAKGLANGVTQMLYDEGDQLLFKGYSSIYATYVPAVLVKDSVVNFFFVNCTDADGNHYPVVNIGGQFWMAENLKTTKYIDGTAITIAAPLDNSTAPTANYPNNDPSKKDVFGMFYRWHAIDPSSNGNKNVAPIGWHIPNYWELNALVTTVGQGNCWYDLRDINSDWLNVDNTPNTEGTNATGFSAKPAGTFWGAAIDPNSANKRTWIWSSTPALSGGLPNVLFLDISAKYPNAPINSSDVNWITCSVRCIHD